MNDIAVGPDGNLWFTDAGQNEIGRITTAGAITKFPVPTAASGVFGIIRAPDGNLWFTEQAANKLGRITPAGVVDRARLHPDLRQRPDQHHHGRRRQAVVDRDGSGKIASVTMP